MTEKTLEMIQSQTMPKNGKVYETLNHEMQNKCKQVKARNEKCAVIERISNTNTANIHKQNKRKGRKVSQTSDSIKTKEGLLIREKAKK